MITRQKNGVRKSPWARVNPIGLEDPNFHAFSPKMGSETQPTDRSSVKDVVKQFKKDRNVRRIPNIAPKENVAPPARNTSIRLSDFVREVPRESFTSKSVSPPSVVAKEPMVPPAPRWKRDYVDDPNFDLTPTVRYTDYLYEALGIPLAPPVPLVPPAPVQSAPEKEEEEDIEVIDVIPSPIRRRPGRPRKHPLPPVASSPPEARRQPQIQKAQEPPPPSVVLHQPSRAAPEVQPRPQSQGRQEVFRFTSNLSLYSTAWSSKSNFVRFAVGSIEKRNNKISLVQLDEVKRELVEKATINYEFPVSHMEFVPDVGNVLPELLAVSSSTLTLYHIGNGAISPINCSGSQKKIYDGITSFHWNEVDPKIIGTGHLDGICTIFDIEVRKALSTTKSPMSAKSQLVAHDAAVHDIEFSCLYGGKNHFSTVGLDGTCRGFDIRCMDTSSVLYSDRQKRPLMRISWSRRDPFHFATFAQNSHEVSICDIRVPGKAVFDLNNHSGVVNGMAWAPHNRQNLCTVGDDGRGLIWDLDSVRKTAAAAGDGSVPMFYPDSEYSVGDDQISQVRWSTAHPHWITVVYGNSVDLLWI